MALKFDKKSVEEQSPEDLKWLVDSRNQIQELLLRLDLHPNQPDGRQWQLFVGAAFSLWRAVFLCHDAQEFSRRHLEPDAKKLLRRVVTRNTIGFSDDLEARAWTGGRVGAATHARITVEVHPDAFYEDMYTTRLRAKLPDATRKEYESALARARASRFVAEQRDVPVSTR